MAKTTIKPGMTYYQFGEHCKGVTANAEGLSDETLFKLKLIDANNLSEEQMDEMFLHATKENQSKYFTTE